jgi:hypothetical protein
LSKFSQSTDGSSHAHSIDRSMVFIGERLQRKHERDWRMVYLCGEEKSNGDPARFRACVPVTSSVRGWLKVCIFFLHL